VAAGPGTIEFGVYFAFISAKEVDRRKNGNTLEVLAEVRFRTKQKVGGSSITTRFCTGSGWDGEFARGTELVFKKMLTFDQWSSQSICPTKTLEPVLEAQAIRPDSLTLAPYPGDPTEEFSILYDGSGYFPIVLMKKPLGIARIKAEKLLLSKLGVDQADMCRLKYMLSTPNFVDPEHAGVDLKFSFCPSSLYVP
jgi:hypothetical protein